MIAASVGDQGKNQKSDVLYVQQLLNKHPFSKGKTDGMPLKEDGACGKNYCRHSAISSRGGWPG